VAVASASVRAPSVGEAVPRATAGGVTVARTVEPRVPAVPTGKAPAARTSARPRGVPSAVVSAMPGEVTERDAASDEDAEEALRRRLEAKAGAGKASRDELRRLASVCLRQHDAACVARTNSRIAALPEAP
jgi:hypothetical protein